MGEDFINNDDRKVTSFLPDERVYPNGRESRACFTCGVSLVMKPEMVVWWLAQCIMVER